jgi:4-hydroxyphenylpyruvate dioxygenase
VRDIALWVDDARKAFDLAVERGAKPVQRPTVLRDDSG